MSRASRRLPSTRLTKLFSRQKKTAQKNIEQRIKAIEDRTEITNLVYLYTEAIRNGKQSDCLKLMVENACIELHHANPAEPGKTELLNRFVGVKAIATSFEETAGASAHIWPMIHNLRIELEGNHAKSRCVMMSAIWPHGTGHVGEYRDTYARLAEGWKFTSRVFTNFGDTAGRYAQQAHEEYCLIKK